MDHMMGHGLAATAGFCAAMASTCAKMAFAGDIGFVICMKLTQMVIGEHELGGICENGTLLIRGLLFGLLFVFNGLMWTLFVKSLQRCNNSMEATVMNTASNFFFSGVMGWLIFKESLSLLWWMGASFILMGILIIHQSSTEEAKAKTA